MDERSKLRIVLFALTGFGNAVLDALLAEPAVTVEAVFTVRYAQAFPYYSERQLGVLCDERRLPCYYDVKVGSDEGMELLRQHAPDLIVVATFKQILPQRVLDLPRLGVVNFHPSLLPCYRGPCPTNAALLNDEPVTGVTAHYITAGLDEGNILLQRAIPIATVANDGELRWRLAGLAGEMIPELITLFGGATKPVGTAQDHRLASSAPRPKVEDGYLETAADIQTVRRRLRAYNPLPGTSVLVGDKRVAVDRYELYIDDKGDGLYESADAISFIMGSQAIRLYKKAGS